MHIPPNTSTLESSTREQIRLLTQGSYGTGKTFSAMSAPNPCVINFDNNLGAHSGRKDIINVRFFDNEFVKKYNVQGLRHLALIKWLDVEGHKLSKEQTLVIDGLTNLSNHYDREVGVPMSSKTGREDLMAWWGMKLDWNKEFFENLKSLSCDIIVCCHEAPERTNEGDATGKVLPLVQGSFKDQIGTHFTDIFRQHAVNTLSAPDIDKNQEKLLINYGFKNITDYIKFQNEFKTNTMYLWQLQPDSVANCKTHLVGAPKFARANWNIFSA